MTVQILRPADRQAWLAARKQDVTASVAGALLGDIHPYTTAYQLWAAKSGRIAEDEADNPVLRRGRLLEPVVIEMLREDRPDWKIDYRRDNAYYRHVEDRIGATPDAFATRPDIYGTGILQLKTTAEDKFRRDWLDAETGEINLPLFIAVQAIVEATLTGATWAAVPLMVVGRGIDLRVIDIPLENAPRIMARLRREVREFWRMVDEGIEPAIDWHRDGAAVAEVWGQSAPDRRDLSDHEQLDEMVNRYQLARNTVAEHQATIDDLRPRILHAMGSAEAAFTANWDISAKTQIRQGAGPFGQPSKSRPIRLKPRENPHAYF